MSLPDLTVPQPVGPAGQSTSFGYYDVSPESPDGTRIAYVRFLEEPADRRDGKPGELWLCDVNLQNHRKLCDIPLIRPHNGAEVLWVDDDTLAFATPWNDGPRALYVVDAQTGTNRIEPVRGITDLGHTAHDGRVLFAIDRRSKAPELGEFGIYELDTTTGERHEVLLQRDLNPAIADAPLLPETIQDAYAPDGRTFLHLQHSPDGRRLSFRYDVGPKGPARLSINLDRQTGQVHVIRKMLHTLWYDATTLAGHDKEDRRLTPILITNTGELVDNLADVPGNHFAISPDRQGFLSESDYQSDPVVLHYYQRGDTQPRQTLASFAPLQTTWDKTFHANPSFSRDGKRAYFHMPASDATNGTFVIELKR